MHGLVRLRVLAALQMDGPHNFTKLKKRLNVSDGALGMHLQTLENEAYIAGRKAFVHKRPRTTYRLTSKRRSALARYLDAMRRLLDMVELQETTPRG
ncbi:MAG: transcriptional regulator [Planctomycetota bacterium]